MLIVIVAHSGNSDGSCCASLIPSVSRLTPTTSDATAAAGANGTHGALVRIDRLSAIIAPQSGDGGSTPRPKKPNDEASRIA